MKYHTRKNGSQRPSAIQQVDLMETMPKGDGSSVDPLLWFRIGDTWHAITFETEVEARALISEAQRIYRSF